MSSDRIPPAEYAEYCHCWQVWLERINGHDRHAREAFRRAIREYLPRGVTVLRWPTVWPAVENLFATEFTKLGYEQARQRFVKAVREAETRVF